MNKFIGLTQALALLFLSFAVPIHASASTEPVIAGLSCPESLGATNTWAERYLRLVQMGVSLKILSLVDVESLAQLTKAGSPLFNRVKLPGTQALREAFDRFLATKPSAQEWQVAQAKLGQLAANLRARSEVQTVVREKTRVDLITVKDFPLSAREFGEPRLLLTPQGRVFLIAYEANQRQAHFVIYEPLKSADPIFDMDMNEFGYFTEPHITPEGELFVSAYEFNSKALLIYAPLKSRKPILRYPAIYDLRQKPVNWLTTKSGRTLMSIGEANVLRVFEPLVSNGPIWSSEEYSNITSQQMIEGADGTVYVYAENNSVRIFRERDIGFLLFAIGEKYVHIWKHPMFKPLGPIAMMAVAPGQTLLVEASRDQGLRVLWIEKDFAEYRKYEVQMDQVEYQLEFIRLGERALVMFQTSGRIYLFEPNQAGKHIFYAGRDLEKSFSKVKWQISPSGKLSLARRIGESLGTTAYTQIYQPLHGDDPVWVGEEHNLTPSFAPSFVHISAGEFDRLMVFAPETDSNPRPEPWRVFDPKSGASPFPIKGQPHLKVSAQTMLNHKPNSTLIFYKTSDGTYGIREYTSGGDDE